MIDLGGPPRASPNHPWHDDLFRDWRPDYPDPAPPATPPPPADGLLFQPGPLYPEGEPTAHAPLLPGAATPRPEGPGFDATDRGVAGPQGDPTTAFGNWRGPVGFRDWMQLTPIGLMGRVGLGFASALKGGVPLPGSPQAIQHGWDMRALQHDIDDILAGTIGAGPHQGRIALDPHRAGVTVANNPYDPRTGIRGNAGHPDPGGFGPGGYGGADYGGGGLGTPAGPDAAAGGRESIW